MLLTVLTGITTSLIIKSNNAINKNCPYDFICQHCKKKNHCRIPEAIAYRNNQKHSLQHE